MIKVKNLFKYLNKNKVNFFSGVPDSILKETKSYLESKKKNIHIPVSNEGSAVASAIGYHLSTKKLPCVYMQNSGLSNALNPLISIAHKKVYSIPIFLLIGWRGSPGTHDEPQHLLKGSITVNLLKLLGIKFCIVNKEFDFPKLKRLLSFSLRKKTIVACLIKKGTFNIQQSSKRKKKIRKSNKILRSNFLRVLLQNINRNTKIISTTGFTSRELYQLRKNEKIKNGKDFYMVGGMGHSSMVSLGYSLFSKKQTLCLDGDGSIMMHMGSLANIGNFANKNFKHILLNNHGHESVGGQKTYSEKIKFKNISIGMGYKKYFFLNKSKDIKKILNKFINSEGPSFLEVEIEQKSMKNLLRPKSLYEIKKRFME